MHTGYWYISNILIVITCMNKIVRGNEMTADLRTIQLKSEFDNLSLAKELSFNTIFVVHFQSILMTMASERDFSFHISSDYKLNYIRYPQSYLTTLTQVSSNMHKIFSDTYATMYRLQLAVKRIPDHIKTIIRLLTAGSPMMIQKMVPTSFNNIAGIGNENIISINKTIDQFTDLFNFLNEIKQLPIDITIKFNINPLDKTDLALYTGFDSKNILEKLCNAVQQMKKQFEQIVPLFINRTIKARFDLYNNDEIIRSIPILYGIEKNAYFLYQLSSIYTDISNRYVSDQIAGSGRYVLLSTNEERFACLSNLSHQLSNTLDNVEQLFIEHQNEYQTNNIILQQAYETVLDKFQNRPTIPILL